MSATNRRKCCCGGVCCNQIGCCFGDRSRGTIAWNLTQVVQTWGGGADPGWHTRTFANVPTARNPHGACLRWRQPMEWGAMNAFHGAKDIFGIWSLTHTGIRVPPFPAHHTIRFGQDQTLSGTFLGDCCGFSFGGGALYIEKWAANARGPHAATYGRGDISFAVSDNPCCRVAATGGCLGQATDCGGLCPEGLP